MSSSTIPARRKARGTDRLPPAAALVTPQFAMRMSQQRGRAELRLSGEDVGPRPLDEQARQVRCPIHHRTGRHDGSPPIPNRAPGLFAGRVEHPRSSLRVASRDTGLARKGPS